MEDDIGEFKRISVPLLRRIYPQLIANKIVSIQPMPGPTGLQHYLRFRYSPQSDVQPEVLTRRKRIKSKRYRSIDDPWQESE